MTGIGSEERRLVAFLDERLDRVESALAALLTDPDRARRHRPRDARAAYEALWALSRGSDCFYDLPPIGDLYASWYHLRRVQHLTWALRDLMLTDQSVPLDVVDLGTGTGATPWAIELLEEYRREVLGLQPRRIGVLAVDASPFMLETARHLWSLRDHIEGGPSVEFRLQSWSDRTASYPREAWFVASYLLDHSDSSRMREVAEDVDAIITAASGRGLVLVGTDAPAKRDSQDTIVGLLAGDEIGDAVSRWSVQRPSPLVVRGGSATAATAARAALLAGYGIGGSDRPVTWDHGADRYSVVLERDDAGPARLRLLPVSGAELALDESQERVAVPGAGPALIRGVAGSGKSEVLVARLVRTVELEHARKARDGRNNRRETRILVTAFNKAIVAHLRARFLAVWQSDPLRSTPRPVGRYCLRTGATCRHQLGEPGDMDCELELGSGDGKRIVRVRFMNWDKVVYRVLARNLQIPVPSITRTHAEKLAALAPAGGGGRTRTANLDLAFLEAELQAVVFGLECLSKQAYIRVKRVGRRAARLVREDRPEIWDRLMEGRFRTFIHVRHEVLRCLSEGSRLPDDELFDHALVDEGQDLTRGDLRLVGSLLRDGKGLVLTFDPAQALHLGAAAVEPRSVPLPTGPRRNFRRFDLTHTHRLSHRISTAVRPLAVEVLRAQLAVKGSPIPAGAVGATDGAEGSVLLPVPRKSAVPGARPIVIDGTDSDAARDVIADVLGAYRGYLDLRLHGSAPGPGGAATGARILFVERDDDLYFPLASRLRELNIRYQSMTGSGGSVDSPGNRILTGGQWKGLEFPVVVWSTTAMPTFADESESEVVYTALTRATSVIVIVIRPGTSAGVAQALSAVRDDDLYFWNSEAETAWRRLTRGQGRSDAGVDA